jgi:hypothetical protein
MQFRSTGKKTPPLAPLYETGFAQNVQHRKSFLCDLCVIKYLLVHNMTQNISYIQTEFDTGITYFSLGWATMTKQNLGHLAPASEVAGGHTITF